MLFAGWSFVWTTIKIFGEALFRIYGGKHKMFTDKCWGRGCKKLTTFNQVVFRVRAPQRTFTHALFTLLVIFRVDNFFDFNFVSFQPMQNHLPLMRCTTRAAQQTVLSIVGVSQTGYQKTFYKKPLPALEPFRRLEFSRIKDMPLSGKINLKLFRHFYLQIASIHCFN